ncbi:MAG: 3-deoxy-manno-octulosonate cytidylyltransferase [Planctomycetes bacterium RBG_16_64_10]|nr:MAG: 3-deoxy-manno-octulosonate cytidylyltransferase [Planctomycetes bacterium RBG_16_64_10]
MKVAGIIPARWASSRLPGKPLKDILGKPMIQRVYEGAARATVLDSVWVATDDDRIRAAVEAFGGRVILTAPNHPSGTDRLAEAIDSVEADLVVNIQGDQPFIDPSMIDEAVRPMVEDPSIEMSTLVYEITRPEDLHDPSVVKAVVDRHGFALYFSRSLIPYPQKDVPHSVYEHVGLYVYRRAFLKTLAALKPTPLEQVESLEQLRVLEHGYRIRVVELRCPDKAFSGFSVDTAEDLERAAAMLRERDAT